MNKLAYLQDHGDRIEIVNANVTKRNALSPEYYQVLHEGIEIANSEPRITSVILRGEGGFFCAGGDLTMIAKRSDMSLEERSRKIDELNAVVRAIYNCKKPVIAAVEGGAAGAGVSLVFACDFIITEETAKFTIAYVKAGLVPDGGMTSTVSAHLPKATLMRMALLGEPVLGSRLYELGAVSHLVKKGKVVEEVNAVAGKLAAGPSATHSEIKKLVQLAQQNDLDAQMNAERNAMGKAMGSPEAKEGIDAFLSKRTADFKKLRG